MSINWHDIIVPQESLLEIFVRGTIMYLGILIAMRLFRRAGGSLGVVDLLLIVLIADAAQNGMAGEYRSVGGGLVLVGTLMAWSYALDWLSFHVKFVEHLLQPPPIVLVRDGRIDHRALRRELVSMSELREHLREHGIEKVEEVHKCLLEANGKISVLKAGGGEVESPDDGTPGAG